MALNRKKKSQYNLVFTVVLVVVALVVLALWRNDRTKLEKSQQATIPTTDSEKPVEKTAKHLEGKTTFPVAPISSDPGAGLTTKLPEDILRAAVGTPPPLPPEFQAQLNAPPPPLPEDLKNQLNAPPIELPPDLAAQLNAPPPELPEDIKNALNTPPRVVTLEEVNTPPEIKPEMEK